ncbi:MAG: hypothetical protein QW625_02680 [Candidatus Nanoarchaeia archaeon]
MLFLNSILSFINQENKKAVIKMRIVVDIDGTLTRIKYPYEKYLGLKPYKKFVSWLTKMKKEGHTIIVYSSRGMRTYDGNIGRITANYGPDILNWLKKNNIPCDELYFGKPFCDIIIDDQAISFSHLDDMQEKIRQTFPVFIITMAGEGKRFKEKGYTEPKFAILARGKPLFYWSLKSLPLDTAQKIIFVCLERYKSILQKLVLKIMKDLGYNNTFIKNKISFVYLKYTTKGQAITALKAKPLLVASGLYQNTPIVIYNIDTSFVSTRLSQRLLTFAKQGYIGLMGLFFSEKENLSFAKIRGDLIIETAEKKKISKFASTGLYAFKSMKLFEEAVRTVGDDITQEYGELYIAPLYNYLIKKYKYVTYDVCEKAFLLGTPSEVEEFNKGDIPE